MKRLISLCLATVLALALAAPAGAAADGGVKVQVNGQLVDFPNAGPAVVNGRTMVPMRAVLEALGARVDYDAATGTAHAALGDIAITHVIGTDQIDIAGAEALTMDTVSYVKNGATLVPLRFFSQALGYEVYWDGGANTAVVIDRQAVIDRIDESFTILNGLQAKRAGALDPSGNTAMDMDFSGEIKLLDSIGGDKSLPFFMKMSALCGPGAVNLEGTMDLSALALLAGEEDAAETGLMASMLKDLSFSMIYGEAVWMQIPALTDYLRQSGEELPQGEVWMKTGAAGMSMQSVMGASASTVGGTLYAMAELADKDVPASIYDDLTRAAGLAAALMGDGTFTRGGEDYRWKLDEAASARLAEALGASGVSLPLAMEMTVKADGSCEFAMDLSVEQAAVMSMSGTAGSTSASFKGQLQVKNACDVTFQCEMKLQASDKAPAAAPAEGEPVIDLDDYGAVPLTGAGVIGGADGPAAVFPAA